jgi:hypothetical protein
MELGPDFSFLITPVTSVGIFKQNVGARGNRVGIGLSYSSASLAELVPWNRFLGSF